MEKVFNKKLQTFGIFASICVILLGVGGCKRIPIPDGKIIVSNECGLAIDFFLDGVFKFSVEYEQTESIENLEDGTYLLEAKRTGSNIFVSNETLSVVFNRIYTWSVLSSASIKVINNYGEPLNIYGDDILVGGVEDQADATMSHVPYGDRKIEAKTSNDTLVATTTISVLFDNTYEWTITR